MKNLFKKIIKNIPLMLVCIFLAFFVWIFATMTSDPTEEGRFSQTISIEIVGLGEKEIITTGIPSSVSANLRAPSSVWRRISLERVPAKAIIDVTDLGPGTHQVPVDVKIEISPIQIISISPSTATIVIEEIDEREFVVQVDESGDIPTAFRADTPVVDPETVTISGTVAQLDKIDKVSVSLERDNNTTETIQTTLPVSAYSEDGRVVRDITISPEKVDVTQEIRMRGGYRILSVKLSVKGEIANGYRVENLSVDPGFVTVYSADKELLNSLNSYIETEPIYLDELYTTTSRKLSLNIPEGITLVGDTTVTVTVEISAIESTTSISEIPVSVVGLDDGLEAYISPSTIDVVLSGPMVSLAEIKEEDIHAIVGVQDLLEGNYQLAPSVEVASADTITVQSIQPAIIEVQITGVPTKADDENKNID